MTALMAVLAANPPSIPKELVKPEVAAARVAACSFGKVRPMFDETLQEDVIEVRAVTSASEQQLHCIALASLGSGYYVVFPPSLDRRYQALYWRLLRDQGKADAKLWLEKRGLLSRLPAYDPKRSDSATFARVIERLCGPKAAGALQPAPGMATFSKRLSAGKIDDETLWCLLNAAAASGYPLGFTGNEAYRQNP
jgi:hypothetical protein